MEYLCLKQQFQAVALLAEGVDRNLITIQISHTKRKSPSSRRAWIEIVIKLAFVVVKSVALLAEGVDRNNVNQGTNLMADASPSSRRAWIEILRWLRLPHQDWVALLAEGVDRNHERGCAAAAHRGRPPRGGRG